MRVVTCEGAAFSGACAELAARVAAVYAPDVVIGVEDGGAWVTRELRRQSAFDAVYATVSTQRSGTRTKARTARLLSRLPLVIRDGLRLAEHAFRVHRAGRGAVPRRVVAFPEGTRAAVALAHRVLIVDDAVDSGATLKAVLRQVETTTNAEVRTAALAMTFPQPVVAPDFVIYRNVLLRLPWSSDARS